MAAPVAVEQPGTTWVLNTHRVAEAMIGRIEAFTTVVDTIHAPGGGAGKFGIDRPFADAF